MCVNNTRVMLDNRNVPEIEERVQILRLLVGINQKLLEKRNVFDETPLFAHDVHVKLRLELISLGANIFGQKTGEASILHHAADDYSTEEYHAFLASIPENSLRELVNIQGTSGRTPLQSVIFWFDPREETLALFKAAGADFNISDEAGEPALVIAIRIGRKAMTLRSLIKYGADFSWTKDGTNLLHIAAEHGHVEAIQFLIKENLVDVNCYDGNGDTSLHRVMKCNQYANKDYFGATKILLDNEADPNLVDRVGDTPFESLVKKKFDFHVAQLLKSKTDLKWTPTLSYIWIITICQQGMENLEAELNSFEEECKENGVSLNLDYLDEEGNTLLHLSAKYSYDRALRFLIEKKGLQVNTRNGKRETVLHTAAKESTMEVSFEIIKYLIEHGAEVYAEDTNGFTFLHNYILKLNKTTERFSYNQQQMVEYLVKNDWSSLFETRGGEDGDTPLHLLFSRGAIENPSKETLSLLHSSGVNFNAVDKFGNSLLYYPIKNWRITECISNLIAIGVDWKILNHHGSSVLHTCAKLGNAKALRLFLELKQLDVNGLDADGNTPLHCAVTEDVSDDFQLEDKDDEEDYKKELEERIFEKCLSLIERKADITIQNGEGDTPVALALKRNISDTRLLKKLGLGS